MARWSGKQVAVARAAIAATLPAPCWRCGRTVTVDDDWHTGHIIDRALRPDLANDPSNWAPEHALCNLRAGGKLARKIQLADAKPRKVTSRDW